MMLKEMWYNMSSIEADGQYHVQDVWHASQSIEDSPESEKTYGRSYPGNMNTITIMTRSCYDDMIKA